MKKQRDMFQMKIKPQKINLNEMEISNLPDKKFNKLS